jgi:CheY-like chemotaxis protein
MARILVYGDHKCILELYRRELQDEGYDVLAVSSLRDALAYFQSESPALVLFSIWRPGAEELGTIEQMLSRNRRIPIVFTSSFTDQVDPGLAGLGDAYVEQLSDLAVLKQAIKDLCPSDYASRMVLGKLSPRLPAEYRAAPADDSSTRHTSSARSAV